MAYAPGDYVHVALFGKGIVREVRNGGRYLVEVKERAMVVAGSQLRPVEEPPCGPARAAQPSGGSERDGGEGAAARTFIDLHGKTVDEAVAALDAFLNDAMLAGVGEARVIHGRSGGRLKAAVHARLKQLTSVGSYRVDPANPGVTIVTL